MSRTNQIIEASIVPIGGCEDAAKERVKRLFRKNNDINYSKLDSESIENMDKEYTKLKNRYSILIDKLLGAGTTEEEADEIVLIESIIGLDIPVEYIQRIILLSSNTFAMINLETDLKVISHIKDIVDIVDIVCSVYSHKLGTFKRGDMGLMIGNEYKPTYKRYNAYFALLRRVNDMLPKNRQSYVAMSKKIKYIRHISDKIYLDNKYIIGGTQ